MQESPNSPPPVDSTSHPRAVIDIGTNSIKLLVAKVAGSSVQPVIEKSEQTRLGQGFYETRQLQPRAIATTVDAVETFVREAKECGAESIRVIATSAARDAENSAQLLDAIFERCGFEVEVISGEQEARWVFQGVTSDPALSDRLLLIVDIGGGSTEFVLGKGRDDFFRNSFRLGTVRLLEQFQFDDPPGLEQLKNCRGWLDAFLAQEIMPSLSRVLHGVGQSPQLVATGGTATILARVERQLTTFDRGAVEGAVISAESVRRHMEMQWCLPLAERKKTVGLPSSRADVFITGLAIMDAILTALDVKSLRVSTRGLRYAALIHHR